MSKLIIICGLPGSGKTTLADELSRELNVVCLHKDSIKEILYESLGFSNLDDSRKLGKYSVSLLYKLTAEQLTSGVDIIIEAPFYFEEDYKLFRKWEDAYNAKIYSIVCHIEDDVRKKRFMERERHEAHHDVDRLVENNEHDMPDTEGVYEKLPGKIIKVHTNKPTRELTTEILKKLK